MSAVRRTAHRATTVTAVCLGVAGGGAVLALAAAGPGQAATTPTPTTHLSFAATPVPARPAVAPSNGTTVSIAAPPFATSGARGLPPTAVPAGGGSTAPSAGASDWAVGGVAALGLVLMIAGGTVAVRRH